MASTKRNLSDFSLFYDWVNITSHMLETPKLYSLDSEKKLRVWQMKGRLIKPNNQAAYGQNWDLLQDNQLPFKIEYLDGTMDLPASDFQYWIESGYVEGKLSRYAPSYTEEKNISKDGKKKKNFRNLIQQGCVAMQSKYMKRLEEGAKGSIAELNSGPAKTDDCNTFYWAMLATHYKQDYSKISFPCYAQIKMNGVRMITFIADKEVITYSRDLKEIPGIPTIKKSLVYPLRELYNEDSQKSLRIDGEIFGFDVPLNEISGWARNTAINSDVTKVTQIVNSRDPPRKVGYFIFDVFDPSNLNLTFAERLDYLNTIKGLADGKVESVSFPFNLTNAKKLAEHEYKRALEHFNNTKGTIETHGKRTEEQEFLKDDYPFDSFSEWHDTLSQMSTTHKAFNFETIGDLTFVPTLKVSNKAELLTLYYAAVDLKFEGLMARNSNGLYYTSTENKTTENRSIELQKLKPWYDEEFELVGYTTGKGRNNGAIIWVCKTSSGNQFNCDPKNMTIDARKALYAEFANKPHKFEDEYQGLMMTVQYEEKNLKSGIPQRAKAVGIRSMG
jgi:hypothetical protein